MSTTREEQAEESKQLNMAHLHNMLSQPSTGDQYSVYIDKRKDAGFSTYAPLHNVVRDAKHTQAVKKTVINSIFFEEQLIDFFYLPEKLNKNRSTLSGDLFENNRAACENLFAQTINAVHYISTVIQLSYAMAKIQCTYAKFNGVPDTSLSEFALNNIRYITANPNCALLGGPGADQKMSKFVYDEAVLRVCPPVPEPNDPNHDNINRQIAETQNVCADSRLRYFLTFLVECRQKMRKLNETLRLSDGFNKIILPILLDSVTKLFSESQQLLPANVGVIGETLNNLDNILSGCAPGL